MLKYVLVLLTLSTISFAEQYYRVCYRIPIGSVVYNYEPYKFLEGCTTRPETKGLASFFADTGNGTWGKNTHWIEEYPNPNEVIKNDSPSKTEKDLTRCKKDNNIVQCFTRQLLWLTEEERKFIKSRVESISGLEEVEVKKYSINVTVSELFSTDEVSLQLLKLLKEQK